MEIKNLTQEQKDLIDKVLLNEYNMLEKYCTSQNGQTIDTQHLGYTVLTLLKIKRRGSYYINEVLTDPRDIEEQELLNHFRTEYLRKRG